ncbi:hypothetical protein [Roseospira visakhapatnamensis]|uniref:Uncharacterized protein n=1 Tax=Roseospira visakhapatnamensis TaxID=390880 RepID=A0A7W6RDF0_9PROT|nr:hypothetical protein [Roseospira visakhapatnamensis]MBB4266531.1 hypothetical protein [Roseospira visakhapatnamensis]
MFPVFPFFPFAFVPPVPFMAPFAGPFAAFFPFARTGRESTGDTDAPATARPAQAMMHQAMASLALMPFTAPMTVSTQMAQAFRDAGRVAREMKESLELDEGPVHVMIGDPNTPNGLAIGITVYRGGGAPAMRDVRDVGAPALNGPAPRGPADAVDVTPHRPASV